MADEIRIRDTGEVITVGQFRARHPNTSFPRTIPATTLDKFGADPVLETPRPATDRLHTAQRNGVEQDANGNWVQAWQTVDIRDGLDQAGMDALTAKLKGEWRKAATSQFWQNRNGGTTMADGTKIETDHAAAQEISELVRKLERNGGTQRAVTRSGVVLTVDLEAAQAMRDAVDAHISACLAREADLYEAIDAETTPEGVVNIDTSAGWPE